MVGETWIFLTQTTDYILKWLMRDLKLVAADIIDLVQMRFMQGRFIACIYDIPAALIAINFHKVFDVIDVIERNFFILLIM